MVARLCYTSRMVLISPTEPQSASGDLARFAVLASGSGSNFEAICEAAADGRAPAKICGLVYNNPDARVADRAARLGVPATLVNHRDFDSREGFDAAVVEALRAFDIDWVAMAGWMRIATPVLLEAFPDRILNIHPSLLPAFRGLHAIEQAVAAGVRITGCTVHIVRPAVDDGPIIAQAAVPILPGENLATITERVHAAEHQLYPRAIAHVVTESP